MDIYNKAHESEINDDYCLICFVVSVFLAYDVAPLMSPLPRSWLVAAWFVRVESRGALCAFFDVPDNHRCIATVSYLPLTPCSKPGIVFENRQRERARFAPLRQTALGHGGRHDGGSASKGGAPAH